MMDTYTLPLTCSLCTALVLNLAVEHRVDGIRSVIWPLREGSAGEAYAVKTH